MELSDPLKLRETLRRHGARAATSLGQRFLVDEVALDAIIHAADIGPADHVLEVGPGPGVLTRELAKRAASVTSIEVDARMVKVLGETLAEFNNCKVVHADALAVDLFSLGPFPPTRIVANLPYQITSPLLMKFLGDPRRPAVVVVLVQEEVARRIVADSASARERGFLSIFVQSFSEPVLIRRVPRTSFQPAPRVDSAIVAFRTLPEPAFAPLEQEPFLRFVSDAFRHRRKQLQAALGYEAGVSRDRAAAALKLAGIDPRTRPEQLSIEQWKQLMLALGD